MPLATHQIRHLRALAHHLKPVAETGYAGYTPAFVAELAAALAAAELVKVRITCPERDDFAELAARMAADTDAELVQTIGRIAVLYRPAAEPRIMLPPPRDEGR